MSTVKLKSVILANRRRVRPETLQAIIEAKDGEIILVDPAELDSFTQLTIYEPDVRAVAKGKKDGILDEKRGRVTLDEVEGKSALGEG